ncbi:MAG: malate synthase G, partial [Rhodospirillaceae bacterium]|nr:malate synthase G [Rhodospirillaceae bacterium]
MSERVVIGGLQVDAALHRFIEEEAIPGTGVAAPAFWQALETLLADLSPRNRELLAKRDALQEKIDAWHKANRGQGFDGTAYKAFLAEIGYLLPEGEPFKIETSGVDREISVIAGPQLVVPVNNARYALNAANARWGSLYDALYGTDVIPEDDGADRTAAYNPVRGAKVIARARQLLDQAAPLASGSHSRAVDYSVRKEHLVVSLGGGGESMLADPGVFVGYTGAAERPERLLFRHHNLHLEVVIDRTHPIGKDDPAGVADVLVESAITTIMDCEDSVAAVDGEDKAEVYRNWLGLMKGDLKAAFPKGDREIHRSLNPDKSFQTPNGGSTTVPGRSLMLVRNVGHLMTTPAVLDKDGNEVFEGLLDAFVTCMIALHDLKGTGPYKNSRAGSIYIVKPKMHGPEEVAFADALFGRVEDALGMPRYTVKMGIMDEERRTTLNLMECIRAAKHRVAFINTGFLDRTGDEIHTSMEAGAMIRKNDMKGSVWIAAYEDNNVDIGLACGLPGKAQIGKGMWAMPDRMADM